MAVGLITEAKQAEEIVASGKADMVALARGMLYDPRWGWHAAAELGGHVDAPPQYWRSQPSSKRTCSATTTFGGGSASFALVPSTSAGGVDAARCRRIQRCLSLSASSPCAPQ